MNIRYFFKRMKDVKLHDLAQVFPMLCAVLLRPFFNKKYKDYWLIYETDVEARDNGYWFFRKIRENHPQQKCIYAISRKSVDYKRVAEIGDTVQSGSLKHWIIYFTCQYNVSSQKGDGKPNPVLCAFIELNNLYNAHNIFLQHGVIINKTEWLFAERTRLDMFVTSTQPETEYIKKYFGYPESVIKQCGLPRFDNLHNRKTKRGRVVVMPTWRSWFTLPSQIQTGITSDFKESIYYKSWSSFLKSERLNGLIEKYDLEILFFMHRNMQMFCDDFQDNINNKIKIARWEEYDIQEVLATSEMMITDYSSVFFDMIYMKRPILFYQFDIDEFRRAQYEEGYFRYDDNPFGKSFTNQEELFEEFERIIISDFKCDARYLAAHEEYFDYYDTNNSERVYLAIKALSKSRLYPR